MKKMILILVLLFSFNIISETKISFRVGVNFGYFYNSLNSFGDWYEIENGVYVWKPWNMGLDWQPYSVGRWLWTSDGWYWDSYESFGYITYHYGRWFFDDYYGWVWYPSYDWAPAWVEWRYDDDYIGWAPLPPYALFRYNTGIVFTFSWTAPINYWYFVRYKHFCNDNVWGYGLKSHYKKSLYRNTKIRNNYTHTKERIFNHGINRDFIENKSGYRFAERNIVNTDNIKDLRPSITEVKRYIPNEIETRKYSNVERYDAKNSVGRTSLKLDRVVDENYKIERKNENSSSEIIRNNDTKFNRENGSSVDRENNIIKNNKTDNTTIRNNDVRINRENNNIDKNNSTLRSNNTERKVETNRVENKQTFENRQVERNTSGTLRSNENKSNNTEVRQERTEVKRETNTNRGNTGSRETKSR
ncbi:MAG TPA: hypothetical protein PL041_04905 [Melioribacteraceae bacterium]|nr:hypothetical protein [Melioribacteraceae bacterium]